ncbi:hypothetical protein LAZ67_22000940 [Cordylochernes scorpioides]|uniref:DUF5641 domain-containing protein n=1 Tax=Cordylochernes scorpioides TaxID=51811 RepID=A0ABY6LSV2_9ARAC|nr:hypothetical protein LAZ67_22000940 [Cordylochernes scorpioides]
MLDLELAAVLANDGTKWKTIFPNNDINTVVETYPGRDGLMRVVSVRTSVGVLRGPLVKMVLLPVAPPDLDVHVVQAIIIMVGRNTRGHLRLFIGHDINKDQDGCMDYTEYTGVKRNIKQASIVEGGYRPENGCGMNALDQVKQTEGECLPADVPCGSLTPWIHSECLYEDINDLGELQCDVVAHFCDGARLSGTTAAI